jgi:hypothetical protein
MRRRNTSSKSVWQALRRSTLRVPGQKNREAEHGCNDGGAIRQEAGAQYVVLSYLAFGSSVILLVVDTPRMGTSKTFSEVASNSR